MLMTIGITGLFTWFNKWEIPSRTGVGLFNYWLMHNKTTETQWELRNCRLLILATGSCPVQTVTIGQCEGRDLNLPVVAFFRCAFLNQIGPNFLPF
jgi:hypothetical protein